MHKLWTMLLVGAAGCCVMTSAQSGYAQFEVNEALLDKIENAELMKNLANDAETENQTNSDESKDGAVSESAQDENQKEKKFEVFAFGRGFDCKDPFGFATSSEDVCLKICPNRVFQNGICQLKECPEDKVFRGEDGSCSATPQNGDDTLDKVNAEMNKLDAELSVLAGGDNVDVCPDTHPLLSYGHCYPCDYKYALRVDKKDLAKCSDRIFVMNGWDDKADVVNSYAPCPENEPLRAWNGECFSCDYQGEVRVMDECSIVDLACDVCKNRVIFPKGSINRVSVLKCPEDKPLMDSKGACLPCDVDLDVSVNGLKNQDAACVSACQDSRVLFNDICAFKTPENEQRQVAYYTTLYQTFKNAVAWQKVDEDVFKNKFLYEEFIPISVTARPILISSTQRLRKNEFGVALKQDCAVARNKDNILILQCGDAASPQPQTYSYTFEECNPKAGCQFGGKWLVQESVYSSAGEETESNLYLVK